MTQVYCVCDTEQEAVETVCPWSMRCGGHTYITLYYEGKFVHCYDNDMSYMGSIIEQIEKRTKMKFEKIPIHGNQEDFNGLRFAGGFKYDWCINPITTRECSDCRGGY